MDDKFCIYVSSFDGYSDLWDTFFDIFFCYWPNCKYRICLVNNEINYKREGVDVINTGKEKDWFTRTLKSLESINSRYVLLMLEDYFISKTINNSDFDLITDYMDREDVFFYRLSLSNCKGKGDVIKVPRNKRYAISLQPAIWKREKLIELLKEISGKSPWDFEYYMDSNFRNGAGYIEGIRYDTRDLLGYKNGVLRGKWIPATIKFYKRRGIHIVLGNREQMSLKASIKYSMACFFSDSVGETAKKRIKNLLNKIKFDYLR